MLIDKIKRKVRISIKGAIVLHKEFGVRLFSASKFLKRQNNNYIY